MINVSMEMNVQKLRSALQNFFLLPNVRIYEYLCLIFTVGASPRLLSTYPNSSRTGRV